MLGNNGKTTFMIDAMVDLTPSEQIGSEMINPPDEGAGDEYEHVGHRCEKATHLIVALHGLLGDSSELDNVVKAIVEEGNKSDLKTGYIIVRPTTNEANIRTLEGTQACALRALKPVLEVLEAWPELKEFTLVAHSFGGVYGRVLLKLMADRGILPGATNTIPDTPARLTPISFIALASPFLGSRRNLTGWRNWGNVVVQKSMPYLSEKTGKELLLEDKRMIVHEIATSREYLEPLRQFNRRILYANAYNDSLVPFGTASIEGSNPHEQRQEHPVPLSMRFPSIIGEAESELQLSRVTRGAFEGDEKQEQLLEMLSSLNTLSWTKYHLKIKGVAHTNILGASLFNFGRDIPLHIAQHIFPPSTDPSEFLLL
eukprot:m.261022 g.261022  ORF g.261022 m.261022 type:complete len:371 (+) comp41136_c0_seq1:105-1217(+)